MSGKRKVDLEAVRVLDLMDSTSRDIVRVGQAYWRHYQRVYNNGVEARFINFLGLVASTVSGGISIYNGVKGFIGASDTSAYTINLLINNLSPYSFCVSRFTGGSEMSSNDQSTYMLSPNNSMNITKMDIKHSGFSAYRLQITVDDGDNSSDIQLVIPALNENATAEFGHNQTNYIHTVDTEGVSTRLSSGFMRDKNKLHVYGFEVKYKQFKDPLMIMMTPITNNSGSFVVTFI